ncbi:MAG TPA: serine hydrolase [Candidatus Nitrosotenuis sp.]|jgi:beta-lactamase class A|nr:serine hydrolase [Candidatus Nitrosotenuis sp.]
MSARILAVIVLTSLLALPAGAEGTSNTPRARTLEQKMKAAIARVKGRMAVGVAVIDLASGERVELDARRPYPLASVFKLPILVEVCRQLQQGTSGLSLQTSLPIRNEDRCIGAGRLQFAPAGSKVSLAEAVELMETVSDNTATDLVFGRIGTDSVNRFMHSQGLASADIWLPNRPAYLISLGLGSQWKGLSARQIARKWKAMSRQEKARAVQQVLAENRDLSLADFQAAEDESAGRQTGQAYLADVELAAALDNTCSPADLASLLGRLYQGQLLDRKWTRYALGVLGRQKFNSRLPRHLPAGTRVYHKTGTITGVVNDAGVIELPGGRGLVVVVLVRDVQEGCSAEAGALIGRLARMAYDTYR